MYELKYFPWLLELCLLFKDWWLAIIIMLGLFVSSVSYFILLLTQLFKRIKLININFIRNENIKNP